VTEEMFKENTPKELFLCFALQGYAFFSAVVAWIPFAL
jgi:hypothetical protein